MSLGYQLIGNRGKLGNGLWGGRSHKVPQDFYKKKNPMIFFQNLGIFYVLSFQNFHKKFFDFSKLILYIVPQKKISRSTIDWHIVVLWKIVISCKYITIFLINFQNSAIICTHH